MAPPDRDGPVIFGLDYPARIIATQLGEQEKPIFIAATQSLKAVNQVCVLEFDEDTNQVSRHSFIHRLGEVWHLSCSPLQKELLATCYNNVTDGKINSGCSLWSLSEAQPTEDSTVSELVELSRLDCNAAQGISSFQWQPVSGTKAVASVDNRLVLVDIGSSGKTLKISDVIECETKSQQKVGVSKWNPHHNCNSIAVICEGSVRIYDIRSKSVQFNCDHCHGPVVRDMDFNPNRQYYLATGGDDCKIKIWDVRAFKEPLTTAKHSHWVWCVRYNPVHDQLLLSSSSDERLILHCFSSLSSETYELNDETGENGSESPKLTDGVVRVFEDHEESVYSCEWSAGDPWIFGSLSYDGRVIINKVPRAVKYKILQL